MVKGIEPSDVTRIYNKYIKDSLSEKNKQELIDISRDDVDNIKEYLVSNQLYGGVQNILEYDWSVILLYDLITEGNVKKKVKPKYTGGGVVRDVFVKTKSGGYYRSKPVSWRKEEINTILTLKQKGRTYKQIKEVFGSIGRDRTIGSLKSGYRRYKK